MAEELENKQEPVYGQDERGREANSSESQGNSEQKDYRSSRPQRPRIHSQRAYSSDRSNQGGEGGFRPEGFGAGLQGAQGGQYQGGYRPRNNYQGGYQQRQRTPGYDPNAKYSMKKRIEYKEENYDPNEPLRLNKFLANAGICSRREADEFIQAGVVSVNGEVVTELGTKIKRTDEIKFHDQPVTLEKKVYVLLNKPKDCVTTSDDPQQRKTVMDLVKNVCPERIYPVGRLDRNTTGVLLLTNDGDYSRYLELPANGIPRRYRAQVYGRVAVCFSFNRVVE